MPHPDDHPAHLSVYRAFVVQFDTHTDIERGHLAGQVEHVSLETLLGFIAQLLHTGGRPVDDSET